MLVAVPPLVLFDFAYALLKNFMPSFEGFDSCRYAGTGVEDRTSGALFFTDTGKSIPKEIPTDSEHNSPSANGHVAPRRAFLGVFFGVTHGEPWMQVELDTLDSSYVRLQEFAR